jgi:chromosome segregation ATPase
VFSFKTEAATIMSDRFVLLVLSWLVLMSPSLAQKQDTDVETLKKILVELRAIHQDMRVTETTQLLVAELQMQQATVNRATESADGARAKLNGIHLDQKRAADEVARAEDRLEKAQNLDERNALSQDIDRRKSDVAALKAIERDSNSNLQAMEQRLQNAEDKLANIEGELNAAISRLGAKNPK